MSNETMNGDLIDASSASLRQALNDAKRLGGEERALIEIDLAELEEMDAKLRDGRVDIAVFGEISTGKSALINALLGQKVCIVDPKGGSTIELHRFDWDKCAYTIPGQTGSKVYLVDTPGINEVQGEGRASLARIAAQRADLILFVTDSDLNHSEWDVLHQLAEAHKPIIVVFNKIDNYDKEQRKRLLEVLRDNRLPGMIRPEDIVMAAADPKEREVEILAADGSSRIEWRQSKPQVEDLKIRILEILERDGKGLVALNAAMFAADKGDKLAAVKIKARDSVARKTIWKYVTIKALVVALNPIPIADVAGGFVSDIRMVYVLSKLYGEPVNMHRARQLAMEVIKSAGWVTVTEVATDTLAGIINVTSLGAGLLITAVPQGLVAGRGTYLIGHAAQYYFQHNCGWGPGGPKAVVRDILKNPDTKSKMKDLRAEILEKLKTNRHAGAGAQTNVDVQQTLEKIDEEIEKKIDEVEGIDTKERAGRERTLV